VFVRLSSKLLDLLNNGLVPCVPLRGSISASGDLSPLSYVAGAICGHPDVRVFDTKNKEVLYATEAIEKYKLNKITLAAKEGLGLVNGTAFSASAGCLAFYDALNLASTSLAATAMTVEAMVGQVGSFDQFIHDVTRPHAGQIAAAAFVRSLLAGSKLAVSEEGEVAIQDDVGILRQDRYALRTSAQWIGPQLESLALARSQIEAELNSTTDNPLLDVEGDKIHHGGNFQAMAITQAMESTRLVLEHLGKLSFSQVTELINCSMNRGLPSCLAGDEPSTNYHTKGLDIHSAAYCSELGYLANPVSTHVQSTEMHNQSVNSLALISARKTIESNDVLSLLLGTHLYCAAQAIDLRIADVKFQAQVRQLLNEQIKKHFGSALQGKDLEKLQHKVFVALLKRLEETASSDSGPRFEDASRHIMGHLMETVVPLIAINPGVAASLGSFQKEFLEGSLSLYRSIRKATTTGNDNLADAKENMGSTIVIYQCIRGELGVSVRRGDVAEGKHGRSVGGNVSRIVTALRDGRLVKAVGEAAGYVKIGEQNGAARGGISDPRSMHGHGGSFY